MKKFLFVPLILIITFSTVSLGMVSADDGENPYYSVETVATSDGKLLEKAIIDGPPKPPPGYEFERSAVTLPQTNQIMGTKTLAVPAFDWSFGCSATSGAMIAAYYDRNGYPNMYTGPTNSGVMPLDSSTWPDWTDSYGATYGQCPLTASHLGLDGRAIRGSIDDYWVKYGSSTQDPYITNGWTQHTWGDAIGDYMKTSQSAYANKDGSTTFYNWTILPTQLTCSDMESNSITVDGTYGRKLFYEAKGYTVTTCYNQKTDNNGGGFTYAKYKAEIDAGRPVMINLEGHTVVGVGYNDPSTVYIHDTWDYATHSMTWGGSYSGLTLLSVSIVNLATPVPGTLSGVVSDEDSGTPVVGATVSALGAGQTTSGTGGAYSLGLPGGVYTITASASGYLTETISSISISSGSTTTLNISLTPESSGTGTLSGIVSDEDSGSPIIGATVSALDASQTTSGTGGSYSLGLPTGVYTVTASASGYLTETISSISISKDVTTTLNISLTPESSGTGTLSGIVSDEDTGSPMVGATISALGAGQTTSGTGGAYSLGLPAGVYTVSASASGYLTETVTNVSISEGITTTQNFSLSSPGTLWYAPTTLQTTILSGTSTTVPFTLTNGSTSPMTFTLQESMGSFQSGSISKIEPKITQSAGYFVQTTRHTPAKTGRSAPVSSINRVDTATLLNEGFEGGVMPPTGWSEVVTDAGYHWKIMTSGAPYHGSYAVDVEYDPSLAHQDEWLLSPEINLTQGTLSFWSIGSLYWCRDTYDHCDLNVWLVVGDVGGGDDIFVGKGDDDWTDSWTWSQSVFDLTSLLPYKPVRIGFEYVGSDGAQIALDEITLAGTSTIPWLSENPTSGTLPAMQSQVIDITFDASNIDQVGQYTGTLHVLSGDTANPDQSVPVVMNVIVEDEYTISGNTGVGGVTLTYFNGAPITVTANSYGAYSFSVPSGWSGTVTPSKTGYTFSPVSRIYSRVMTNQTTQNFIASMVPDQFLVFLPFIQQ